MRRATRRLAREWRGVLAVDQFEELFTACQDEERARRVRRRARARRARSRRTRVVVLAVRADFYGRCAAYPELSRLLGANHVLVGPMSRDELRRAIERPAQRAGLSVEPELVDALLADVEGQPGALPLLSTALLELWRERDGRRLRLAAYARSGGVQGAVARLAEDAFVELDPEPAGGGAQRCCCASPTRTRAARSCAAGSRSPSSTGERVGRGRRPARRPPPAHGLATAPSRSRTRRCCASGRGCAPGSRRTCEGRRLHRRLGAAARAWDADGRDPGGLYRGARLASALDWAAEHEPELNATERAFLDDSRRASGRAQRRLRLVLAGRGRAARPRGDRRRSSRSTSAATRAPRRPRPRRSASARRRSPTDDLDRALLLARQGVALDDSPQTRGNLLAALLKSPAAIGVLRGDGDRLTGLDLSPDDRTLAVHRQRRHAALRRHAHAASGGAGH